MDIELRSFEESDLEANFNFGNEEVDFYLMRNLPNKKSRQLEWFESISKYDDEFVYSIINLSGVKVNIGICGIFDLDYINRKCKVWIWVYTACINSGVGTKAIKLIVKEAFDRFGFNRIEANILEINKASKRVFEKNGFILEGTLRKSFYGKGKFYNVCNYSLLKVDYEKNNKS